jgi:uncharacterized protein involved in outer membrane biogenesis
MKNVVRGGVALVLLMVIGLGGYAASLVHSLETPEFKARVAREASALVGTKVQLESVDVSLFRGIRLGGIRARNPPGFGGDLFTVEGAKLSYDLWQLLRGRIQVDELTLRQPAITLVTDGRAFNYQKLSAAAPPGAQAPVPAAASSRLLRISISRLSVDGARFAMVDERKVEVLRLEGGSLDSALAVESGVLTGTGKGSIDSMALANAVFLRGVRAPVTLTRERMTLAPLQAKLGGGAVTGEVSVAFKPEMRYTLQAAVSGASVATLLREAGSAGTMTGVLNARARIEGTGGVATLRGAGNAEIKECRWPKAALFGALADLMKVPELSDPRFDECRVEFALGSGQARTPVVNFKGPAIELTGQGLILLLNSVIDYDLTLALAPGLLAKIPAPVRAGFKPRTDGFGTIAFKVTGTTAAPRTDLAARLGKSTAIEAAKEGLFGKLFGGRKKPQ